MAKKAKDVNFSIKPAEESLEEGLIEVNKRFKNDVQTLEEFQDRLPSIPTEELVGSYEDLNEFKLAVNKFRDAVRDELVEGENARIFTDEKLVDIDEDGNRYITAHGKTIKAGLKRKYSLKQDEAKELLEEKGLYDNVIEKQVKIQGDEEVLNTLRAAINFMKDIQHDHSQTDNVRDEAMKMSEKLEELKDSASVKDKFSEEKLEALVALEFLSLDELQSMYETKETYSLYTVKKNPLREA